MEGFEIKLSNIENKVPCEIEVLVGHDSTEIIINIFTMLFEKEFMERKEVKSIGVTVITFTTNDSDKLRNMINAFLKQGTQLKYSNMN